MKEEKMTEAEAKLAAIIWANAPLLSPDLVKLCEKQLQWKKSTTYTMLKRLEKKGLFENRKGSVEILLTKEEYEAGQSRQFIDQFFNGSLPGFLTAFTKNRKLSKKEICELQKIIDNYKE